MKVHAHVHQGDIVFGSAIARANFFEKFDGKDILIEPNELISAKKRRFFEGCLVPVTFYAHPHSGWQSFADAREVLKLEFLGRDLRGINGEWARVARSTTDLNNKKFGAFIEAVVAWLQENHMVPQEALDPENYIRWRDSAPSPDEIYPPLARLKEVYDKEKQYGQNDQGPVSRITSRCESRPNRARCLLFASALAGCV